MRRGLEEAPSTSSWSLTIQKCGATNPVFGRDASTSTGYEVWYAWGEPRSYIGTGAHVTTKSSIRNWGVLYKSGVYALKVTCLTLGDLLCALGCRMRRKLAEGRVIDPDRIGEVSRRHSRRIETDIILLKHGRTRNPPCNRKSRCRKLSA